MAANEQVRFAELAVFPEDVDIPVGIAARLWAQRGELGEIESEELLIRLQNLSLLVSLDLDQKTFRFHDTVRHFLQDQAGKEALAGLHKLMLQAMEGVDAVGANDLSRRYYYLYRPTHLAEAGERAQLDALLADPRWMQSKMDALANTQALIADYEQFGQNEVHALLKRALRLTSGICARDKRAAVTTSFRAD